MPEHVEAILKRLARGPTSARKLADELKVSQPTISRALAALGAEVVRIGAARSIQYAHRDMLRGLPEIPVYRADASGRSYPLGVLIPVRPDGFVLQGSNAAALHYDGLPWWLLDMRPQGYLGRAYAARFGVTQGLPPRLSDWSDTHALRALLEHGDDLIGNLLLGDSAQERFLIQAEPTPIPPSEILTTYARLAQDASLGELPGSSAGGEQPKFTAFATTAGGPRHVLVKFSETEAGPVSERWRDLLLAEHFALETLRDAGIPAAASRIIDNARQRFLEVERFDRIGTRGRRSLFSLTALDAEFVGAGSAIWPLIVRSLVRCGRVRSDALPRTMLLWAFGTLIGNTDMHAGNLSFTSDQEHPLDDTLSLAPAYDMCPMAFAPRSSGGLPDSLPATAPHPAVEAQYWRQAESLAHAWLTRLRHTDRFSMRFQPCIGALAQHLERAGEMIRRLG